MLIVDVSHKRSILDLDSKFHFKAKYDQLYRACGKGGFEQDSADIVYAGNSSIQASEIYPILLKEWVYLVAPGGCLVIDYATDGFPNSLEIEDELWIQWAGCLEIIEHRIIENNRECNSNSLCFDVNEAILNYSSMEDVGFDAVEKPDEGAFRRIIVRKKKSSKIEGDEMSKWSFGIVTNGKRNEWLSALIESIRQLEIPECEILVCGYLDPDFKDMSKIRYIPFNKRSGMGWLDKKKNLLIQNATHQNIVIMHDRYLFNKDWFEGMGDWGNNFEFMTCAQKFKTEDGVDSTEVLGLNGFNRIRPSLLRKRRSVIMYLLARKDFMKSSYPSGGLVIAKKHFYEKIGGWDENLFWQEGEDIHLAKKFIENGMYCRLNPMASCSVQNYVGPIRTPFGILDNIGIETEGIRNGQIRIKRSLRNIIRYLIMSVMEKSLTSITLNAGIEGLKRLVKILKRVK